MSAARANFPANRRKLLWLAALIHRVSGISLACFLPFHFLALGMVIEGEARLNTLLRWTDAPVVKFAEAFLMFLIFVHLLGGIRLLAIENLPWTNWQKQFATVAFGVSIVLTAVFLARVL